MVWTVDHIIFFAFLILNIILGLKSSKNITSITQYAIGDRNFSTGAIVATIVATWIGGGFFIENIIENYTNGLYMMQIFTFGTTIPLVIYYLSSNVFYSHDLVFFTIINHPEFDLSRIMSTADSYLNSSAVIFVHDFLKSLNVKINNELLTARLVSIIIGILAIILSFKETSIFRLALFTVIDNIVPAMAANWLVLVVMHKYYYSKKKSI